MTDALVVTLPSTTLSRINSITGWRSELSSSSLQLLHGNAAANVVTRTSNYFYLHVERAKSDIDQSLTIKGSEVHGGKR